MASVIIGGGKLDAAREFADEVARQRQLALAEAEFSQRFSASSRSGGGVGGGAAKIVGEFGGEPAQARQQALQVGANGGPVAGYPYFNPGYEYQASGGGGYSRPAQALPGPYPATGPGEAYDTPYVAKMRQIQGVEEQAQYQRQRQEEAGAFAREKFEEQKRKNAAQEKNRDDLEKFAREKLEAKQRGDAAGEIIADRKLRQAQRAKILSLMATGDLHPEMAAALGRDYVALSQEPPASNRPPEQASMPAPGLGRSPVSTSWSPELPTSDRRGPVVPWLPIGLRESLPPTPPMVGGLVPRPTNTGQASPPPAKPAPEPSIAEAAVTQAKARQEKGAREEGRKDDRLAIAKAAEERAAAELARKKERDALIYDIHKETLASLRAAKEPAAKALKIAPQVVRMSKAIGDTKDPKEALTIAQGYSKNLIPEIGQAQAAAAMSQLLSRNPVALRALNARQNGTIDQELEGLGSTNKGFAVTHPFTKQRVEGTFKDWLLEHGVTQEQYAALLNSLRPKPKAQ